MSEPEKKPEAPPPQPPSLGALFEASLTALVNAPGVFHGLSERPAPGGGAVFALALAWGALFFALNLVSVSLSNPGALTAVEPWKLAAVGALGLGVWASLFLLGASILYGLGRALGAEGDYARALLVAAIVLATAPVQALANFFPSAWIVPTVLAAWMAACGLEKLFKANAWAARGVCAVFAAGALALQYGARSFVEQAVAARRFATDAAQAAKAADAFGSNLEGMQQQMLALQQAQQDAMNPQRPAAGGSSLDLLRGPGGEAAPASAQEAQKQMIRQAMAGGEAMNKNMIGMLDSIAPMLDNPMLTKNMPPEQQKDMAELRGMIVGLKADIASGRITSDAEQAQRMAKVQSLVMRMMTAAAAMPKPGQMPGAPGGAPPSPEGKK